MRASDGLSRRSFVDLAGVAGIAAVLPLSAMVEAAPMGVSSPVTGLVAWLRNDTDGNVRATFGAATTDGRWGTLEPTVHLSPPAAGGAYLMTSWCIRQAAIGHARDLLMTLAARGWGVPADQCRCTGGVIRHAQSAREIGYRIWATVT